MAADDTCDLLCIDLDAAERVRHHLPDPPGLAETVEGALGVPGPVRGSAPPRPPAPALSARGEARCLPARGADGLLLIDRGGRCSPRSGRRFRGVRLSAVRELPLHQVQPVRPPEWLRAAKRARHLSWLSLLWMGAEGAVGVVPGVLAGALAPAGFGGA